MTVTYRADWEPDGKPLPRPYPWERDLTVCIAASCRDDATLRNRALVFCTDWRVSGLMGSAETSYKQKHLPHKWRCLTSGDEPDILALTAILAQKFGDETKIDETNVVELIRKALLERKRQKADEFTVGRYGLSYSDFLSLGKEKLPDGLFRDAMMSIEDISLRADLIVAGFAEGFPMMIETSRRCILSVREHYAVVGEGSLLSTAALLQRRQIDVDTISETLYKVYEAKRYAENVNSVGKYTTINIIYADGKEGHVTKTGMDFLDSSFTKFGPQFLSPAFEVDASFIEE